MGHGFITMLLKTFPKNDALESGVRKSVRTIPKIGVLHPLGSCHKDGNGVQLPQW
jgi:hypothetical protein